MIIKLASLLKTPAFRSIISIKGTKIKAGNLASVQRDLLKGFIESIMTNEKLLKELLSDEHILEIIFSNPVLRKNIISQLTEELGELLTPRKTIRAKIITDEGEKIKDFLMRDKTILETFEHVLKQQFTK